jgi:hypothetical protein
VVPLAVLSAEFSIVPCAWPAPEPPEPPEAPETVEAALAAGLEPPDIAKAIPPPARKLARVMPTPQRIIRFLRSGTEGNRP